MNLDPLTQDIWFMPLMCNGWHLWRAGSPESVCGLPWKLAAQAWNGQAEKPTADCCETCSPPAHDGNGK